VAFALDRGGLVGADGKTHQGAFDLSYLRLVPNLVVMAPSDENELRVALATSIHHDGPVAFRFPRGNSVGLPIDPSPQPVEIGKSRVLRKPAGKPDVLLVAAGTPAHAAMAAAVALAETGIEAAVVDARFVKPLDEETICGLAAQARRVVTVEENALAGGFGSACLEAFERAGLVEKGIQVRRLGIPDAFITHGDAARQRAELGIDAAGIAAAARALVGDRAAVGRSAG
jgi:1-deoxy-D-xylulose-5-phosphate synthase